MSPAVSMASEPMGSTRTAPPVSSSKQRRATAAARSGSTSASHVYSVVEFDA